VGAEGVGLMECRSEIAVGWFVGADPGVVAKRWPSQEKEMTQSFMSFRVPKLA
jgi:hypothetical protein